MMPPAPLLSLRDVSISLRNIPAVAPLVRGQSFELARGETLSIVGESGSGKSLTSLAIMRLLAPQTFAVGGKILFEGTDLLALTEEQMRALRGNRISMVFQEPMTSLNPMMTVGAQIRETLFSHQALGARAAQARAIELLERVRIPDAATRLQAWPHELSGGMRQRVMIAMALACTPDILIADEPTTALDVTVQYEILQLLREIQSEMGMGIIFVTHDMGVVNEIADRTLVMSAGEAVETGLTDRIFREPSHEYTRRLIAAVPKPGAMRQAAAPATTPAILELRELEVRFPRRGGLLRRQTGWHQAVDRISLSLPKGKTLGIVGESGSGKSTVARAVMGLQAVSGGDIRLDGRSLLGPDGRRTKDHRIQMIFQDSGAALNPAFTIGAALSEAARLGGNTSRTAAAQLLEQVSLPAQFAQRFPHELSGGQRQRVCIARALALSPEVIIADESVAALDVGTKFQVLDMLAELQRDSGISLLFITHDMSVIERLCHEVVVMCQGRLVEAGPAAAVMSHPLHPYTQDLLSAVLSADPDQRRRQPETKEETVKFSALHIGMQADLPPLHYRTVADGRRVLSAGRPCHQG